MKISKYLDPSLIQIKDNSIAKEKIKDFPPLNKGIGPYSVAQDTCTASSVYSHAEGYITKSSGGLGSHSEGNDTIASGESAHAEGYMSTASGFSSHAEGRYTNTTNAAEHAEGKYNVTIKGKTIHTIGIGDDNVRKNAEETHTNGDRYVIGIGGYDGTNSQTSGIKTVQQVINSQTEGIESIQEVITSIETKINDENFGGIICLNLGSTMDGELVERVVRVLQDTIQSQKHYIISIYDTQMQLFMGDAELLFNSDYNEYTLISNGNFTSEGIYSTLLQFRYVFNKNGSYTRNQDYISFVSSKAYTNLNSRITALENIISQITITEE